jgi:hypothetical protein
MFSGINPVFTKLVPSMQEAKTVPTAAERAEEGKSVVRALRSGLRTLLRCVDGLALN